MIGLVNYSIPLIKPVLTKEMIQSVTESLESDRFLLGENVSKFEEEFAKFIGTDHSVAVNSGTDALILSLIACDIEGKDVITTPASFIASSNSILHAKGNVVFADISMSHYCIDPKEIAKTITPKTSCILPVHLYGYPAPMDEISEIARGKGISIVEDACQAHGAEINGKKVGSFGDAAAFSFYPSKNMTVAGDGGMVTTNDEKIAEKVRKLRNGGRKSKYEHDEIGYTSRMNSVNATIGRMQLKMLSEWNAKRIKTAELYSKLLSNVGDIVLPPKPSENTKPVFHLFVIRTGKRDDLVNWLGEAGIEAMVHYPIPIHLQPIYRKMFHYSDGMYKNSEELSRTCISLPMHPTLEDAEIKLICEKVQEFFNRM